PAGADRPSGAGAGAGPGAGGGYGTSAVRPAVAPPGPVEPVDGARRPSDADGAADERRPSTGFVPPA
ncbi:DUF2662 domain-containing protein, partial [Streptomyces sp. TRM76130]|nr:DUF2662 domain-containing protein [Streptomyces sp. TRM76130]